MIVNFCCKFCGQNSAVKVFINVVIRRSGHKNACIKFVRKLIKGFAEDCAKTVIIVVMITLMLKASKMWCKQIYRYPFFLISEGDFHFFLIEII